jgi:hypothetical protein
VGVGWSRRSFRRFAKTLQKVVNDVFETRHARSRNAPHRFTACLRGVDAVDSLVHGCVSGHLAPLVDLRGALIELFLRAVVFAAELSHAHTCGSIRISQVRKRTCADADDQQEHNDGKGFFHDLSPQTRPVVALRAKNCQLSYAVIMLLAVVDQSSATLW